MNLLLAGWPVDSNILDLTMENIRSYQADQLTGTVHSQIRLMDEMGRK